MRVHLKRLTALLLSSALVLGLAATNASANFPRHEVSAIQIGPVVNPLYQDIVSTEDLVRFDDGPTLASDIIYFTTKEDAGVYLRTQMKARAGTVTFGFNTDDDPSTFGTLINSILWDHALAHTRVPTEGDYLRYQLAGYDPDGSYYYDPSDKQYHINATYHLTYYTTASQEKAVDAAVSKLLKQLNLKGKSRAEKIAAIYEYLCSNVTYDKVNMNDNTYKLKHTAYAAIINHTAVCQGYAVLLYRLLLEEQVDCRVIAGTATNSQNETEGHAWNIVRIGSEYYNVDSTWDTTYYQANYHTLPFYLLNDADFKRHVRRDDYRTTAFYTQYPMSSDSYDTDKAADLTKAHNKNHFWILWSETSSTYSKAGSKLYTCTVCGDSHKDAIPKRNTVTASNVTKTAATKAQTFALKATAKGGTLSYKPSDSKVKVSSAGKVTLPKNYVGKCKITITAKGNGYETAKKTVTVTVNPKGVSLSSVKNVKKKKINVTWKKNTAVTGYHIQYATSSGFKSAKTVTITKPKTDHTTIKSLTKGKTYYVRIQTYKKVSGKQYKSGWSNSKKVKVTK
jgi:transglutaminase-like putative cysteine protease